MGLFRKMTSVATLGAVDLHSDKERIARSGNKNARAAKRTAQQAQAQTRLLTEQNRLLAGQNVPTPATPTTQAQSVEQRLAELDRLAHARVITGEERATRRAEVLRGI